MADLTVSSAVDAMMAAADNAAIRTAIGAGTGDVVGPASATDNAIARYDATTGKLLQNSTATINDAGEVALTHSLSGSGATSLLDLAVTWNTTGSPTAFKVNVTDTASGANSLLADFQVGGSSQVSVSVGGALTAKSLLLAVGGAEPHTGWYRFSSSLLYGFNNGGRWAKIFGSGTYVEFTGGRIDLGAMPTIGVSLKYDANNVLAQVNGTNAQSYRLYNTYTDASNYERGFLRWSSNVFEIGTAAGGTGTARNTFLSAASEVRFGGANVQLFRCDGSKLFPTTDSVTDLGTTANRMRRIYVDAIQADALELTSLPTADPAVAGQLWSNSGVLTVSAG